MADETVEIAFKTTYDGSGAKQAAADQQTVRNGAGASGGSSGIAAGAIATAEQKLRALKAEADQYSSVGAKAAAAGAMRKYNLALGQDRRLQGEILASSQAEAQVARGTGTPDHALEKEIDLRKESLKVQKELNVYESEAIPIAQQRIDARKKADAPPPPNPPTPPPAPAPAPGSPTRQPSPAPPAQPRQRFHPAPWRTSSTLSRGGS